MIEVQRLVKRYGGSRGRAAVDDLSFTVDKGEVVGFLGPNGAGKSTTLRILAGFLGMTSGKVTIAGHDVQGDSLRARQKLGYMPEAVPLYPEMRVVEYLRFRAELKRVRRGEREAHVSEAMKKANVLDVSHTLIGNLSKGYKQRVGLADALVARPPILILDEPTAGLDPNQIREVRDVIRALGEEHTVLLSTHILSEVEASCSRVVVIAKGRLVAEGTMADLARRRRSAGAAFVLRGDEDVALAALRAIPSIAKAERDPEGELGTSGDDVASLFAVRCAWSKKTDAARAPRAIEEAVAALAAAGIAIREVRAVRSSLEEVFGELTRDPDEAPGGPARADQEGEASAPDDAADDDDDDDVDDGEGEAAAEEEDEA